MQKKLLKVTVGALKMHRIYCLVLNWIRVGISLGLLGSSYLKVNLLVKNPGKYVNKKNLFLIVLKKYVSVISVIFL